MPSVRLYPMRTNLMGGVETSLPAHLLQEGVWRTQHNMRLTPELQQVHRKKQVGDVSEGTLAETVGWLGVVPSGTPGYGEMLALTQTKLTRQGGSGWVTVTGGLTDDSTYRRWATSLYDGRLYFTNELNQIRVFDRGTVSLLSNAPAARYLCFWYDHCVVGYPSTNANMVILSDLYDFTKWNPEKTNEADYYEFVEWQQSDYPYTGVTGIGKLKGTLWVYTPTAIIPMRYTGLPGIINVGEDLVITRSGNTYPWTLVTLDNVHFYYNAQEGMFFANGGTGEVVPIGEPIRNYILDNISPDLTQAMKMYGYVDANYREVWWPFISAGNTTGIHDKAVVFNYRYKKWFTASVEGVQCFCNSTHTILQISEL